MRLIFAGRADPGVGVGLELQLVDHDTRQPSPAASSLLELLSDEAGIKRDLYQSLLEIDTGIHPSIQQVDVELRRLTGRLRAVAEAHGLDLIASGTHPSAGWRDLHITEAPPYEAFVRRLQWMGRRAAVFGMRLEVGVPDGEKAIAIGNSLASLVPLFIAMSASSPFWRGFDTGLASCRARVIENIPNGGLPPNLLNFGEFQAYVKTLRAAEAIENITDLWWDVRPNLRRGTIELRACDMPHTQREAIALAALAQAVVVWLLKSYEEGEVIPQHDAWIIRENKWRAARFGIDAELVSTQDGKLVSVRGLFDRIATLVSDIVGRLGLEPQFADLERIFHTRPGYARQRRVLQRFGLERVPLALLEELRQDEALF
jgi:carboxylate-amine ligase